MPAHFPLTVHDVETVAGHPVAWVNNQFQQYVFDVTDFLGSPLNDDTNVTVAFESAWHYGLNVTSRPDADPPLVINVSTAYSCSNHAFVASLMSSVQFEYPDVRQYIRKTQSDFGWDWVRLRPRAS